MQREVLDHACLILSREPTHTLSARALHERTTAELGMALSYASFVQGLAAVPDRFTIVAERPPFGDGWPLPDADRVAAQLQHDGVLRGQTVLLANATTDDEPRTAVTDDVASALAATLADTHAAVLQLLLMERDTNPTAASVHAAVLELEELRRACAAELKRRE